MRSYFHISSAIPYNVCKCFCYLKSCTAEMTPWGIVFTVSQWFHVSLPNSFWPLQPGFINPSCCHKYKDKANWDLHQVYWGHFSRKNSLLGFAREHVSRIVHIHFNVIVATMILLNQKKPRNLTVHLSILGILLTARKSAKNEIICFLLCRVY